MRLNRFIALHSRYSRREADRLIDEGFVFINKTKATLATPLPALILENPKQARDEFRIFVKGKLLDYSSSPSSRHWSAIVYHKKKGELVSSKDDRGRPLIYDSLDSKYAHFRPVGRLDYASEGLLILSDNKEVVRRLMESKLSRVYLVKIDSVVSQAMLAALEGGISLEDARAGGHRLSRICAMDFPPMDFKVIKSGRISKLKIALNEGRNRELRRFFAHFGANVLDLRRVSYGFVNLNALPLGKTRFFTRDEYTALKEFLKNA